MVNKHQPDLLYGRYVFPMSDIFEDGVVVIPNFVNFDPEYMNICTKRHFRNYSLVLNDTFIETDFYKNKLGRINMIERPTNEEDAHIKLIQTEEEAVIRGIWKGFKVNVMSELMDTAKVQQYEKVLKFYICETEDPDTYEEALEFEWKDLIPKKHSHFYIPTNLLDKSIFYSGNKIKIILASTGETNENSDN